MELTLECVCIDLYEIMQICKATVFVFVIGYERQMVSGFSSGLFLEY